MKTLLKHVALALAIGVTVAPGLTQAQTAPAAAWKSSGGFIALSAADAPAMSRWYKEMLGFEAVSEGEVPGRNIRFALLRRGDTLVEILQRADTTAPAPGANGQREAWRTQGYFKTGLFVDDLEGLEATLKARGVTFSHGIVQPKDNPWRTFVVRDPEGNILQFFGK